MTTQVFCASTAFGLVTLAAALEDGAFAPAERRVLVLSNNARIPEAATSITDVRGIGLLLQLFDAVYDYNAVIAPQHPSEWRPRAVDLPLLERFLAEAWSLVGDLHLVVECVWTAPALTLCTIFPDARIDAYADGLMSYGPTRNAVPLLVAVRIERLLHLDLVPGLVPVLLSEFGVPAQTIAADAFRTVVALLGTLPPAIAEAPAGSVAVLLGQYLSALDILTPDEETSLHLDMVQGAVAAGFRRLVFKPHPGAPPLHVAPLQAEAGRLGAELTVEDEPALVESWFGAPAIGCVVGCFSTALLTAASGYGLPAARVGTRLVMERLRPFHNSNRIPLTLVDACLPDVGRLRAGPEIPVDVTALVRAVSYCMQPDRYPGLRADAQALLEQSWPTLGRYFRRRRLTLLDLPGRLEPRSAPWGLLDARRRAARHLRNLGRAGGIVRAARRLGAASSKPRTSAHPRRSLAPRARTSPAGEGPGVLGQDLIDR